VVAVSFADDVSLIGLVANVCQGHLLRQAMN